MFRPRFKSTTGPSIEDKISKSTISGIQGGSIMSVIKHDHSELKQFYVKIKEAKDDDTKTRYQNQFTWELARHSIGEELVVYPAMEKYVDGGKDMAQKDRDEHQKVKEYLYEFQGLAPSDDKFHSTLDSLWSTLTKHIEEEEQHDLPALEKALPENEGDSLAKSFARTKLFVPTRSHPMAPDKPPFETLVGFLAAPIDKLGDLFRKFPREEDTIGKL
ncbi:hypothetical protein A1O1_05811 [Capronia coronata CBS 617.96]|uniref:Hemerythrin-like domain-containing protein n=1 Tax=Capronia coronata CBS 617.96 TaxID=1182541 RepID=W9XY46_9EURO|nr:uncharacterized protein A1O1_05811 [Capronia coronata CBS 617.96]EXJ85447.1 hypothetical protein A1O1_05811 [Capronia coronata CBS 617.96]